MVVDLCLKLYYLFTSIRVYSVHNIIAISIYSMAYCVSFSKSLKCGKHYSIFRLLCIFD